MNTQPSQAAKDQPINWPSVYFLFGTLLGACTLAPLYIYYNGLSWPLLAIVLVTYTMANMSITAGYHRLFAHRAYEIPVWLEWVVVVVSAMAFQGTITQWATDHRRHHRKVDTEDDPYNINEGLWWAHMGWMLHVDSEQYRGKYAADLMANPRVMWQDRNYIWLASVMSFGVPTLLGWCVGQPWGGLIVGGILRQVLSQQSTFFINSLCHYFGGRPYNDGISARDNSILAVLTFGEGYHNYHHTFQADYRNGIYWYQWDPTKWLINFLWQVGLATRLKRAQSQEIFKARLAMEEKRLLQKGHEGQRVKQMRLQLEEAFVRFRAMREEYKVKKRELRARLSEQIAQLRANRNNSQQDSREKLNEWKRAYELQRKSLRADLKTAHHDLRNARVRWRSQLSRNSMAA